MNPLSIQPTGYNAFQASRFGKLNKDLAYLKYAPPKEDPVRGHYDKMVEAAEGLATTEPNKAVVDNIGHHFDVVPVAVRKDGEFTSKIRFILSETTPVDPNHPKIIRIPGTIATVAELKDKFQTVVLAGQALVNQQKETPWYTSLVKTLTKPFKADKTGSAAPDTSPAASASAPPAKPEPLLLGTTTPNTPEPPAPPSPGQGPSFTMGTASHFSLPDDIPTASSPPAQRAGIPAPLLSVTGTPVVPLPPVSAT